MLAASGGLLLAWLPMPPGLVVLAELGWWAFSGAELWRTWSGYRRVAGLRIHGDGSVDVEAPDGRVSGAAIVAGTVTLARIAWLRYRGPTGRPFAEPVTRTAQERDDWRRFRVICRHVPAC